ncbi:putative AC transposase, partial [Bienertia sinuspersici]
IQWWKNRFSKCPVLARIFKDILVILASTIASKSAFSASRRVLDEKRYRLAPQSIEIHVCKKTGIKPRREYKDLEKKRKMKMTNG